VAHALANRLVRILARYAASGPHPSNVEKNIARMLLRVPSLEISRMMLLILMVNWPHKVVGLGAECRVASNE